ncbi:MAG: CRISPR-associated helicase Cas3' [Deltaproteobacteria bacterium]|nr:CRISPR-associated helicase Cas3' [Deltaproteobacteria bacterium]
MHEDKKELFRKLYKSVIQNYRPYSHQRDCWLNLMGNENVILAVGTGGGKTESVLLPSIAKGCRTIILYPTKALLEDQKLRIERVLENLSQGIGYNQLYLTVDTGDEQDRTLYRADIILTTIDKFLYRVFGYGSARWGYIYPTRIVFNPIKPTILIFDEAHVYESVALTHFLFLIEKLTYEKRTHTAILSATLPKNMLEILTCTNFFPSPDNKPLFKIILEKQDEIKRGVCTYAGHLNWEDVSLRAINSYRKGKRTVIVVNRVYPDEKSRKPSIKTIFEELRNSLNHKETRNLVLYHGHQFPSQRQKQLSNLLRCQSEPFILITTSAFEVGVDISSDTMLTEICMPDSFIQRIGRCARREKEEGQIYTFGESNWFFHKEEKEVSSSLLDLLLQIKGQEIGDIKNEINELNTKNIGKLKNYRNSIVYASDLSLYQYIYDFVPEGLDTWRKGILATRDWLPSIHIQWGDNETNRLRLSANHFIPTKFIEDWWIEYRDEAHLSLQGKVLKSNDPKELGLKPGKNKITLNAREYSLVTKSSTGVGSDFGLIERITVVPKRSWGGLGIQKCETTYKVPERNGVKAISIVWYKPEEENE